MSLTQDLSWSLGRSIALQLRCQTDLLLLYYKLLPAVRSSSKHGRRRSSLLLYSISMPFTGRSYQNSLLNLIQHRHMFQSIVSACTPNDHKIASTSLSTCNRTDCSCTHMVWLLSDWLHLLVDPFFWCLDFSFLDSVLDCCLELPLPFLFCRCPMLTLLYVREDMLLTGVVGRDLCIDDCNGDCIGDCIGE